MAIPEQSTGIKIAKGFAYVLSRVVIVLAVIWILGVAYQTAVNTMTVNMVVEEAFAKRAQYVLSPAADGSDMLALQKLFTPRALETDEMLTSDIYRTPEYDVTEFYARATISDHIVWSWQNEATVEVTDIVRDIKASSNAEPDAMGRIPTPDVPEWKNGVYEVRVVKNANSEGWMIDGLTFTETAFFDTTPIVTPAPTFDTASTTVPEAEEVEVPTVVVEGVSPE